MLSLPSLAPQDSYSLWYTTSSQPLPPFVTENDNSNTASSPEQRRRLYSNYGQYRTPLARLQLDEEYIAHRKQNITDYGSSWLKPPGIFKSLHQLREEEREMREHQEAMRREQLAQELAEAEAVEADGDGITGGDFEVDEDMEVGDLDDEVPDADEQSSSEPEDEDEDEEAEEEDDEEDDADEEIRDGGSRLVLPGILSAHGAQDTYREALLRERILHDQHSTADEEEVSGLLREEDLVHHIEAPQRLSTIDIDLDDDIPEGAGYEHTDTEEEDISSDEDDSISISPQGASMASMVRSDGTQDSLDFSAVQSSSMPQIRSQHRHS